MFKYLFLGCIFYEILFSKKPFIGGRRTIIENIVRGKYQPISDSMLKIKFKYGDIIPHLLKVDPKSRLNASEVVKILDAPDRDKPLPDTAVVVQEMKPTKSEDALATMKAEPETFSSFGTAWNQVAMAEDNLIERLNSRLRSKEIEDGWRIGQSGQLDGAVTGNNYQEQRTSVSHTRLLSDLANCWQIGQQTAPTDNRLHRFLVELARSRAYEDGKSPNKKPRKGSKPEILRFQDLQDADSSCNTSDVNRLEAAVSKVVSYQMTPKEAISHYNLTTKVLFDTLLGKTDEERMSILDKVDLSNEMEQEVISFCRENEEQLSYRAVINLVRELKGGASEE